jgi:hypothetical protein
MRGRSRRPSRTTDFRSFAPRWCLSFQRRGDVVVFVVTSIFHGLFTPWLPPKFFKHSCEPLFFNASLSSAEKIAKWRKRPTTSVQLATSELLLALLAM